MLNLLFAANYGGGFALDKAFSKSWWWICFRYQSKVPDGPRCLHHCWPSSWARLKAWSPWLASCHCDASLKVMDYFHQIERDTQTNITASLDIFRSNSWRQIVILIYFCVVPYFEIRDEQRPLFWSKSRASSLILEEGTNIIPYFGIRDEHPPLLWNKGRIPYLVL